VWVITVFWSSFVWRAPPRERNNAQTLFLQVNPALSIHHCPLGLWPACIWELRYIAGLSSYTGGHRSNCPFKLQHSSHLSSRCLRKLTMETPFQLQSQLQPSQISQVCESYWDKQGDCTPSGMKTRWGWWQGQTITWIKGRLQHDFLTDLTHDVLDTPSYAACVWRSYCGLKRSKKLSSRFCKLWRGWHSSMSESTPKPNNPAPCLLTISVSPSPFNFFTHCLPWSLSTSKIQNATPPTSLELGHHLEKPIVNFFVNHTYDLLSDDLAHLSLLKLVLWGNSCRCIQKK